jgi:hypothetical protein
MEELRSRRSRRKVVRQSCTQIKHIHVSRYKSMCILNRGAAGPNPNLSFQGRQQGFAIIKI